MALTLVTAPTVEPVSLAEAKSHLRVDITDDNAYITSLITVVRMQVEEWLRRALITQTWRLTLDTWPAADHFLLPWPALQSVAGVAYIDDDGDSNTFSASKYIVDTDSEPGRVALNRGETWPGDTLQAINGVQVTYVAGYGDAASDVPEAIQQAILLQIGDLYENREATLIAQGATVTQLPAAERLLWPYRVF